MPPTHRISIRTRRTPLRVALATGIALAAAATAAGPVGTAAAANPAPEPTAAAQSQRVEYFTGPDAHPRHTDVPASPALSSSEREKIKGDGDVVPIVQAGPTGTKLDVVFIGDGYTASQQEDFHADVRAKWAKVSAVEPYASYKSLFNVWAVDAVSRQSGVSNDPTNGTVKDTALGSAFFCDGIERLLCVDTNKVETYAKKAADPDLVIVLANSTKYGGAGYNDITSPSGYDGIATASSDNAQSDQVVVHETGHSLGKLADEYWYEEYGTYTGAEPWESNISKLTAAQLTAQKKKWYRWIGQASPDGGKVGAYEGGGYYPRGLYRPTADSIMRTLGREFNLPGREAMIAGFHRHASVVTAETPTDRAVRRDDKVRVRAADGIKLRWSVDGREVRRARGDLVVTPRSLGVPADGRTHELTVRATDPTDAVRAPDLRALLTDSLTWRVGR
ncbi:M64 family metallopeptidase [Streptomyces sp. Je 1-369]|uniref:M64 family metallopeptidase n=1 Tax=Streptomyces sp. Je 1-369 TaxID=2966192 RepID=UPI0022861747|nr:M64 family metallopeptidase [Streptomyces sp. Je 1-369]WAL99772.1 M64 family metallopeptidase [Streptomyces sp. Je 1-369]